MNRFKVVNSNIQWDLNKSSHIKLTYLFDTTNTICDYNLIYGDVSNTPINKHRTVFEIKLGV